MDVFLFVRLIPKDVDQLVQGELQEEAERSLRGHGKHAYTRFVTGQECILHIYRYETFVHACVFVSLHSGRIGGPVSHHRLITRTGY